MEPLADPKLKIEAKRVTDVPPGTFNLTI